MDAYFTLLCIALIGFVAFHQWLRHHRRILVHRERLAAVEKGIDLPPLEQEVRRSAWNGQRLLLLAGLAWISIGVGVFAVLSALLANGSPAASEIPNGIQWVGLAPFGIGVSHLVVYAVGQKQDR